MVARILSSFAAGLLFGLGLVISGMVNPAKVQNFLDVTGAWDPSLALVMGAALGVTSIGYRGLRVLSHPVFEAQFQWPTATDINVRLLAGAALFGAGWGLGGFCPGPALSATALGRAEVYIFLTAMIGAVLVWRWVVSPRLVARSA
jgi:uncharacterized membrane protein YedE/YeeE